ncbi:helix-turn-helix domain-containing protein [Microbacterium sp. M3]|uniref:Helix-turn-helix domain-containing protein n=1 Tax=Microbacterium arthrosphaerae TaxID=792652 RepID=A0ABU4H350_9MICO|nr:MULTISPECIES: helix-turn-helix domain-containing protein [Microbacterium]MDW4573746.1 helix-turn-helix domain-containing protein [Microbacterium arthrosphaerae]MDW7607601.1 helix-turn-helix domain-containing protein [Microbacterium sp. M3]
MNIDAPLARRGGGASPFLSVGAAARLAGLTPATLTRRLVQGDLPGYRLGSRWFVPEAEFRRQLRRRAWMLRADAAPDVVHELTRVLPPVVGVDELERFFGLRLPLLYESLRMPRFAALAIRGGATTVAVLERTLIDARNACPPCLAQDARSARVAA